jgi:hypothetical protein
MVTPGKPHRASAEVDLAINESMPDTCIIDTSPTEEHVPRTTGD